MNRRGFLHSACGCCAAFLPGLAFGQAPPWQVPSRFSRPDIATEEGGLWSMMDREETRLRRSPFSIRDAALREYVQGIACRLGGDHCPDVRVHLVHTPMFNASMAPNGMMQVWSGLLLRVDNEAQLAAVLAHEIGHYVERHSLENLRDVKSRSAFAQVLGLFGVVGAIGQIAMLAGMFAHSREQERVADRISVHLMHKAGYDPAEAGKVWENLLLEMQAGGDGDPARKSPMFASHPPADERRDALGTLAATFAGGVTNEDVWRRAVRPFRSQWLGDEVKRGQYDESIALMTRLLTLDAVQPDVLNARAEAYRLRARDADLDAAIADYQGAAAMEGAPAEVHRGLGMIYRTRRQVPDAKASFQRYLELSPVAPDALMIKNYVEEMGA